MMARIAAREFNDFETFSIEQRTLDDFGAASAEAGLMYAGQSWHWMNLTPDLSVRPCTQTWGWLCVFGIARGNASFIRSRNG